jgi:hypothetical protein
MSQAGAGPEKSCLASDDSDGHRGKPIRLKNKEIGAVELEGKLLSCLELAAKRRSETFQEEGESAIHFSEP